MIMDYESGDTFYSDDVTSGFTYYAGDSDRCHLCHDSIYECECICGLCGSSIDPETNMCLAGCDD